MHIMGSWIHCNIVYVNNKTDIDVKAEFIGWFDVRRWMEFGINSSVSYSSHYTLVIL